jgi:hypothetical protein
MTSDQGIYSLLRHLPYRTVYNNAMFSTPYSGAMDPSGLMRSWGHGLSTVSVYDLP